MSKEIINSAKKGRNSLWISLSLFAGLALGITSQRIPEIKYYSDEIFRPIEKSSFLNELKVRLGYVDVKLPPSEPYPNLVDAYKKETPLPGHPISSFLIHRPHYSLAYDAQHHNPSWVLEHLTAENIKGDANHLHTDFKEDDSLPVHLRASVADYKGKGLAYGQMAAAGNHRVNQESISDTYFLTNICPQCPQLNLGYWSNLEQYVRNLTKHYQNIFAITGPLYLPYDERGIRYVKYRVVGQNDVAVPTHFFKVLILEDHEGKKERMAYILPNHEIPLDYSLDHFKSTIQKVEQMAGIIFP